MKKTEKYKCQHCPIEFVTLEAQKAHISDAHPNSKSEPKEPERRLLKHKCQFCGLNFSILRVLQEHITNVHKFKYGHYKSQSLLLHKNP